MKGYSARARSYVARAKKHGGSFEWFEPQEIFERDEFVCHEYPGKPCKCGKAADPSVEYPHPDFPTLGHVIALANGGDHLRTTTCTQRWECNARQNNEVDTPTNAKIGRQRKMMLPREEREAKSKSRPIQSRGFQGSRAFNGTVRWKGRQS